MGWNYLALDFLKPVLDADMMNLPRLPSRILQEWEDQEPGNFSWAQTVQGFGEGKKEGCFYMAWKAEKNFLRKVILGVGFHSWRGTAR